MEKLSLRSSHLPRSAAIAFEPRKSPVQARSTASVDAILDATIQVLLRAGREALTTTRVAARAGVSVGTLYQYFPNKNALLQATLRRHLDEVTDAVETVCRQQKGQRLGTMACALVDGFLAAKMKDPKTSVALYSVSSDVDGAKIAKRMALRTNEAITAMLKTSSDPMSKDPELIASMLQGTMAGVSRRLLESKEPEKQLDSVREELMFLVRGYLESCSATC
jgi:AcrR family transcriptional regulator